MTIDDMIKELQEMKKKTDGSCEVYVRKNNGSEVLTTDLVVYSAENEVLEDDEGTYVFLGTYIVIEENE